METKRHGAVSDSSIVLNGIICVATDVGWWRLAGVAFYRGISSQIALGISVLRFPAAQCEVGHIRWGRCTGVWLYWCLWPIDELNHLLGILRYKKFLIIRISDSRCGGGGAMFDSWQGREALILATATRSTVEPTQWVMGLFSWAQSTVYEADRSSQLNMFINLTMFVFPTVVVDCHFKV
jgi:hypothetical protein